ncbi:MAG TPA: hypothetical protein VK138_04150 [Acidiferrobacterales bacterium]|nr:hypothetical protein [Acidiferrobacterales bacterium]
MFVGQQWVLLASLAVIIIGISLYQGHKTHDKLVGIDRDEFVRLLKQA